MKDTKDVRVEIYERLSAKPGLSFGYAIPVEEWHELRAARGPVEPMLYAQEAQRAEKRRRVVDMVAAQIAHALTNALIDGK